MSTQNVNVTQITKKIPPIVHVVQGDSGRTIVATVADASIAGSASMSFERPDGTVYTANCRLDDTASTITADLTSDMLNVAGNAKATFKVTSSNKTVSTFILYVAVEPSAGFGQTPSSASNKIYVYVNGSAVEIAKQADLTSLTSRVTTNESSITTINTKQTADETELQNIRVKADGTTATSAGNAVREQINDLNDKTSYIKEDVVDIQRNIYDVKSDFNDCVNGSINPTNGSNSNTGSLKHIRCTFFWAKKGTLFVNNGYEFSVNEYTDKSTSTFTASSGFGLKTYTLGADCYVRIAVRSDEEFADLDLSKYISVYHGKKESPQSIPIEMYTGTVDITARKNYTDIIAKWDALMAKYPNYLTKKTLGTDASGTYTIYAYALKGNGDKYTNTQTGFANKKVVWISCIHGAESTVAEADYRMFESIIELNAANQNYLFGNVNFEIVPVANPWGMDNNLRYNYNKINLNRNFPSNDWTYISPDDDQYNASGDNPGDQAETQIIMNLINQNSDATVCINRHQSESLTSGGIISYIKSKYDTDRALARMVFGELSTLARKTCPWIVTDVPDNAKRNQFNVKKTSNSTGTMDTWYNEKGIHGFLYESAGSLGNAYTDSGNAKFKDLWKINVTAMLSLLHIFCKNAEYISD